MRALYLCVVLVIFLFFKLKTAYELRISDWSSDVCSSDLHKRPAMDQFARLVVGSNAAVGATDEDFRIRDRAAHRGRMAGDQRGVEIGRTKCLGQPDRKSVV